MKKWLIAFLLSMSSLVGAASWPASARSSAPTPSAPAPPRGADYLSTSSSGQDQCDMPVDQRVGNWYCIQRTEASGAHPSVMKSLALTPDGGWCNTSGCYHRYDDLHADFGSTYAYWGYGGKQLGQEQHYVNWQLAGAQAWSNVVTWQNSVATTDVVFSGSLVNAAPGAVGSLVKGTFSTYVVGSVSAHSVARWTPKGFKSYDNTMWDHSQVHEFTWSYLGSPGYWYTYVKSISMHTSDKKYYRFLGVGQESASPFGAGYRSP